MSKKPQYDPAVTGVLDGLTARKCRKKANGASYPKGICSAALHCGTPPPTPIIEKPLYHVTIPRKSFDKEIEI